MVGKYNKKDKTKNNEIKRKSYRKLFTKLSNSKI